MTHALVVWEAGLEAKLGELAANKEEAHNTLAWRMVGILLKEMANNQNAYALTLTDQRQNSSGMLAPPKC